MKRRVRSVECGLTFWIALVLIWCGQITAASAQNLAPRLKPLELPTAAASRSVQELAFDADGQLHGVACGKDVWLFSYDPPTTKFVWSHNLFQNQPQDQAFPNGSLAISANNQFVVSYRKPVEGRKYGLGGMMVGRFLAADRDGHAGMSWMMSASTDFVALMGDPKRALYYALSATGEVLCYGLGNHLEDHPKDLGHIASRQPQPEAGPYVNWMPEPEHLPQALALDNQGAVYTVGENGAIMRGSNADKHADGQWFMDKVAQAPAEPGREAWATLDAAAVDAAGLIYGGTSDGYIFTFNPQTHQVVNLGKPLREARIQGLSFSGGRLIGVGGETGPPQAFSFDPQPHGFTLLGPLQTTDGKTITAPLGAMAADKNGNIYIGTTGQQGNLYLWAAQ